MKRILIIVVCILLSAPLLQAQSYHGPGYINMRNEIIDGDSTVFVDIIPIYIFNKPADMRKYAKLVRNVKKVYPIAKEAKAKLANMEAALMTINGKKAQKAYIKKMEKEIKKQYTPVLKNMTFAQGKVLIKLIDRETDKTSYAIVKELRGGFSAVFWQGIARIFGANLKDTYDKKGEDKVIEQIILMYEAGLI